MQSCNIDEINSLKSKWKEKNIHFGFITYGLYV